MNIIELRVDLAGNFYKYKTFVSIWLLFGRLLSQSEVVINLLLVCNFVILYVTVLFTMLALL